MPYNYFIHFYPDHLFKLKTNPDYDPVKFVMILTTVLRCIYIYPNLNIYIYIYLRGYITGNTMQDIRQFERMESDFFLND